MRNLLLIATVLFGSIPCANLSAGEVATNGWVKWSVASGGNDHWYKAVATNTTWAHADAIARSEGGYLATISSSAENDFVFSLVNSSTFFPDIRGAGAGPALGGSQVEGALEPYGGWNWITGETWNFSQWSWGEPNDYYPNENRLHYWSGSPGVPAANWNDIREDDALGGYVIERSSDSEFTRPGFYGQVFIGNPSVGTPIAAAVIVQKASGATVRTVPTNPAGQFYTFVNPGEYKLIVVRRGQRISTREISLNQDAYVTTNVTVFSHHLSRIDVNLERQQLP